MTERILSLCVTAKNITKNEKYFLFRIADLINGELIKFEKDSIYNTTKINRISMDPKEVQLNELGIWEWSSEESNPLKQWSARAPERVYELAFLDDDLLGSSDDKLVEILRTGFTVPEYISSDFLLVFKMTSYDYYVVEISLADCIRYDNIIRVNKNCKSLNSYILHKDSFIDTADLNIKVDYSEVAPRRLVYNEIDLPEPTRSVYMKTFEELLVEYLGGMTKKLGYSGSQRVTIKNFLADAFEKIDEINEFFIRHIPNSEHYSEFFYKAKYTLEEYLSTETRMEALLKGTIENIPDLTEKFTSLVTQKWFSEQNMRRESLENEIKSLESRMEIGREELIIATNKRNGLIDEINAIDNKKADLKKNCDQLEAYLGERIKAIQDDTGAFLGEIAVIKSMLQQEDISKPSIYHMPSCSKNTEQTEIVDSIVILEEVLGENLESIGIDKSFSSILASYFIGAYFSNTPVLLTGISTRRIADAISISVCASTADVIQIPTGYKAFEKLYKEVMNCKSKVVLIENAVGYNDEYCSVGLIKEVKDKLLIFSVEFEETLQLLPKGFLGYMCMGWYEPVLRSINSGEFNSAIVKEDLVTLFSSKDYKANYKNVSEYTQALKMTNAYSLTRADLLSTIDCFNKDNSLLSLILFEIIPYARIYDKMDELLELVDLQGFNPRAKGLIELLMEKDS